MKIEVELWVENFGQEMRGDRTSMDLYYPITQRDQTQKSHGHYRWLGLILYQSQEPMYWRVIL